jgi:hypothetical protein
MPKKISEETKQQAHALREQGLTYKEISDLLDISEDWCKRNLTKIETLRSKLFNSMLKQSKTKEGISKGQISSKLGLYDMPSDKAIKILNNTTARIRKEDKENIVRPDWMHPRMATYINRKINEEVLTLEQRLHEQAEDVSYAMEQECKSQTDIDMLPTVGQIKSAILSLTTAMCSSKAGSLTKLSNWTKSLAETSNKLKEKNKVLEPTDDFCIDVEESTFSDLEQEMY